MSEAGTNTLVVTTLSDVVSETDAILSLREAIGLANDMEGLQTIVFDTAIAWGTVLLSEGSISVEDDTVILGAAEGSDGVTSIDADGGSGIFEIGDDLTVSLHSLGLINGANKDGGAVLAVDGVVLTVADGILIGNEAEKDGRAIAIGDDSLLMIGGGEISGNEAGKNGGAISVGKKTGVVI